MADVIVSKIQHRRGLRRDLPQPLDPGELGYCTDTGQVFIGAETDQYALHSLSVVLYDNEVSLENTANDIIRNRLFQFNGIASDATLPGDFNKIVSYIEDDVEKFRGYSAYTAPQAESADSLLNVSGQTFSRGVLDLIKTNEDPEIDVAYTLDDSYAIAELINEVYDPNLDGDDNPETNNPGLVATQQNIEILSEFSDIPSLAHPFAEVSLPDTDDLDAPILTYDVENGDSFIIEYSLYDRDGTAYSRVGRLKIVTQGGTAILLDDYSEIVDDSFDIVIDFTSDIENNKVGVYYKIVGAPDDMDFAFTTNTLKWKSF